MVQGNREDGLELMKSMYVWKCRRKLVSMYRNTYIENKKKFDFNVGYSFLEYFKSLTETF